MKSTKKALFFLLILALTAACGGGGGGGGTASSTLVSISVTPFNPILENGTSQQFTATGFFSDQSTADVTDSVIWDSSAPSVTTVSNDPDSPGLATLAAAGITTITATSQSIIGSIILTVTEGNVAATNVLPITVNGALCSPTNSFPNKACVSVTIGTPGTPTFQTVNNILLDTGSYGLRIFKDALTVSLPQVAGPSGGALAECIQFGDGSSLWGPVQRASVTLANEPAIEVPIQVIDSTFGSRPNACLNARQNPAQALYTGILGIGVLAYDCGPDCENVANNQIYYACSGSVCSPSRAPLASQVRNPATLLPEDNNGLIIQLPAVPPNGTSSVNGKLIFGIGTQSNNQPSTVTTFNTSPVGRFTTELEGSSYISYLDTGSNGLFFSPPPAFNLPSCPSPNAVWFCPPSTVSLTATNRADSGSPSGPVSFQIGNFVDLFSTSNSVFAQIGGTFGGDFTWGMPFFYGRDVYVGFEGAASTLGAGPYWAY